MANPMVLAAGINAGAGLIGANNTTNTTGSSSGKQYLDLSKEGYDKIIKDILSSDAGLAALATGENLSGGYAASVKAQLAQDLVLNIAGEMAKLTAPTIQEAESKSKTKKRLSVICTELERQELLDPDLYDAGHKHFLSLPEETVAGYRVWADKVVPIMRDYPIIAHMLAPIAESRYRMIVHRHFGVLGAITIYIGQPICFVIGKLLKAINEQQGTDNGNFRKTP